MDVNAIVELFRRTVTEHYFDMNGRVSRSEYWWFVAACFVVFIIAAIIDAVVTFGILRPVVGLALLLPMAGMGARRLQDIGRSGQLVWILVGLSAMTQIIALLAALSGPFGALGLVMFLPFLGLLSLATLAMAVVLIYFWVQPGNAEANQFGPPPPEFSPMPATPKAG